MHKNNVNVCWIPTDDNKEDNSLNKQVDHDDWFTTNNLVSY